MRLGEMRMLVPLPDEVFQVKASSWRRARASSLQDIWTQVPFFDYEARLLKERRGVRRTLSDTLCVGTRLGQLS